MGSPPAAGPPKPQAKALNCPGCGAAITLRSLGQAVNVVCESCHTILDAKDPNLQVLQQFKAATYEAQPLVPLGKRGKIRGVDYEVIGFQRRSILVEGVRYDWHEYLLFNPYKGYRYLSEYQGHWNDIAICKELPSAGQGFSSASGADYLGETYRHFQTADAVTSFVLGEFPWQVRVGEHATVTDYVKPPRVLSSEKTDGEVTWSIGEYMYGADVWKAFQLPGSAPSAIGVYENQPSPVSDNVKIVWSAFALFAVVLLAMMAGFGIFAKQESVLHAAYQVNPGPIKGEASFVTDTFELTGRPSTVEIKTSADVQNNWIYLNYALINQDSGEAWDFGREVSFYSGYDGGESWSEGKQNDTVVVPRVPAGHYYLRVEPEVDPNHPRIVYTVDVKRDVPVLNFFGIGLIALLVPAVIITWRSISFERARWSESDHPPIQFKTEDD